MPHSPRLSEGRVWLLNSGTGELGWADLDRGAFEPVAFCPGYLRGLAFHGPYAIAGLSKPRRNRAFQGLALDDRLEAKDSDARCGLWIVDTRTGGVAHWLQIEGVVEELYDVAVLPGVRQPMALGFKSDEINRLVTMEQGGRALFHALTDVETDTAVQATLAQPFSERAPLPAPQPALPAAEGYRYQLSLDMTLAAALQHFDALTFPVLSQEARFQAIGEPLVAVLASLAGQPAGLVLAERRPDDGGARVRSLFVAPAHRRRGVGSALLRALARGLYAQGCPYVEIAYRRDWPFRPVIERLLQSEGWLPQRTENDLRVARKVLAGDRAGGVA
jgi:GNAT superfamily N-acetyltransferase